MNVWVAVWVGVLVFLVYKTVRQLQAEGWLPTTEQIAEWLRYYSTGGE